MELDSLFLPFSVLPFKEQFPGLGPHRPPQQNSGPALGWERVQRGGAETLGQESERGDQNRQEEGKARATHQACLLQGRGPPSALGRFLPFPWVPALSPCSPGLQAESPGQESWPWELVAASRPGP